MTIKLEPGAERPRCACCNKPLPKHTTAVYWNGYKDPPAANREEAQRRTNLQIVSVKKHSDGKIWCAGLWDGVTWVGPFCTNNCTMHFAFAAYKAGYRLKA